MVLRSPEGVATSGNERRGWHERRSKWRCRRALHAQRAALLAGEHACEQETAHAFVAVAQERFAVTPEMPEVTKPYGKHAKGG